jgi:hypothetical protein
MGVFKNALYLGHGGEDFLELLIGEIFKINALYFGREGRVELFDRDSFKVCHVVRDVNILTRQYSYTETTCWSTFPSLMDG